MLREMKPPRGDRAVAAAEDEVDLGGDERVSPLLVSDSWLSQSLGGKRFVAAEHVKQLGVDVLLRLGCERFSIETFLKIMENKEDATVESGNPGLWLREAHALLHRHMRPEHVRTVRSLPLFEVYDDEEVLECSSGDTDLDGYTDLNDEVEFFRLVAASSQPPLFRSSASDGNLRQQALGSAAVRLITSRNTRTSEQRALLDAMCIKQLDGASAVRAVAEQHAAGSPQLSLSACWFGLTLVREHLIEFLTSEAERAHKSGESASDGARAALDWLKAALCVPCTDGWLRGSCESYSRSFLGVFKEPSRLVGLRQELPPRLVVRQAKSHQTKVHKGWGHTLLGTPNRAAAGAGMVRATSSDADGSLTHSMSAQFSVRESFESDGNGKGRQMVNTVRSGSFSWSDAQCSASVSSGRVYFEAKWTRGEVAIGLGIGFTGVGHDVTLALSRGRYALSVLISADGYLSIIYAGHKSPVEGPPLPSGGTLGLALDATAGALFLVTSLGGPLLNGGQHTLRQLERRAPRGWHRRPLRHCAAEGALPRRTLPNSCSTHRLNGQTG